MEREITKRYSNGEINVVWKPKLCIHAAECVKRLPQVYDTSKRPWITAENGKTDELIEQIKACPSGALTYEYLDGHKEEPVSAGINIDIAKDGPIIIQGDITITNHDGTTEQRSNRTALCRCGHSQNKPYCDGAHRKEGWQG